MQYIIDQITLFTEERRETVSIIITDSKIRYIGAPIVRKSLMKMETKPFIMTPSFIFFAPDLPESSFDQFKTYFSNQFILKGCGTIITNFNLNYDYEFDKVIRDKRTALLNSPLDFILGVKVQAAKVSPTLMKKCKSGKVPIVFMEFQEIQDLLKIPWGWIREAAFPLNPVFIPYFPPDMKGFRQKILIQKWTQILKEEKIPHLPHPLAIHTPLNIETLKILGLFPKKGILKVGGEISYNLYFRNRKMKYPKSFFDDGVHPVISVNKDTFISINQKPIFRPGFGEEIQIKRTSLFV